MKRATCLYFPMILLAIHMVTPSAAMQDRLEEIIQKPRNIQEIMDANQSAEKHTNPDSILKYREITLLLARKYNHSKWQDMAVNKLAGTLGFLHAPEELVGYYEKKLAMTEKEEDATGAMHHSMMLGTITFLWRQYELSIEYFLKGRELSEMAEDIRAEAFICKNLCDIYRKLFEYANAIEYGQKSLTLYRQIGNDNDVAIALNLLGNIYWEDGRNDIALKYLSESLEIREKISDLHGVAGCLNNIGNIYRSKNDRNRALEYYVRSSQIHEELGDSLYIAGSYCNLGLIHASLGNVQKAREYYRRSMQINKGIPNYEGFILVTNNLANLYYVNKDFRKSVEYLLLSLDVAIRHEMLSQQEEVYHYLAETYANAGDYKKACESRKNCMRVGDSLRQVYSLEEIQELEIRYATAQKVRENEILSKEKEIQELNIRQVRIGRNTLLISSGLTALMILILFSRYRIKRKAGQMLQKNNTDLEQVIARQKESELMLRSLTAEKEKLLLLLTHDLREPVRELVSGTARLSKVQKDESGDIYGEICAIRDKADMIYGIFETLVKISLLYSGKTEPEPDNCSILSIFHSAFGGRKDGIYELMSLKPGHDYDVYTDIPMAAYILQKITERLQISGGDNGPGITIFQNRGRTCINIRYLKEQGSDLDFFRQVMSDLPDPGGQIREVPESLEGKKRNLESFLIGEYAVMLNVRIELNEYANKSPALSVCFPADRETFKTAHHE